MYSPKIREDLIPRIYRVAKEAALPMTTWVNQALERALPGEQQQLNERKENNSYDQNRNGTETGTSRHGNLHHR